MTSNDTSNHTNPENNQRQEDLGLAGKMAKAFIHSPLTPLLLIASLAIGMLGLVIAPRQEDPQISVPMVDVFVRYPGASAEQVATLVADPLQRLMGELTGVKHVYSASMRDAAMVTVQFKVGEDLESSLVKLYDRLESNMDKIPPGVSQPLVKPKGVDDVPIVTLTLWSGEVDDATLNLVALDVLQRLNEVPNTSQGYVVHGRTEQVRVEVQPETLEGHGVTLGHIAKTIAAANSEMGVGGLEFSGQTFNLYTGAYLESKGDIEQLVLGIKGGRPIYVRDVANVVLGPSETHSMVRYYTGSAYPLKHVSHGDSAVTIAIAKKKGSNGVTVAEAILDKVAYLKGRIIPDNVVVSTTRNYGQSAKDKVNELLFKLFIATAAVAVLVFLFLGLRAATVVVIIIPIVILVTVFLGWIMDYTIDRVSLFALIFSIGILVDDAIVVLENIYRRWLEKGEMDTETSVDAVREVGNPTILATLTVIAALLPMGFVSGMMGPYMQPIPALGSVAMIFSLFAAFIFTPWLTFLLRPSLEKLEKAEEKEHRQSERMGRMYHKLLIPMITNRLLGWGFLVSIIVVFFLCCALFYTKDVRVKMLPLDNKPEFNVVVNLPEGTALPITANLVHSIAERLRNIEEVTDIQSYVGTASPFNFNGLVRHYYLRDKSWMGDIQVELTHKTKRARTSHDIAVQARAMIKSMDMGEARIQVVEMPPGPPVLQSVVAEVYGPSAEVRRKVVEDMTGMFEKAEYIDDVDNYLEADYQMWRFVVNREKALRLGISVDDINKTLEMAMGGYILGDIKTQALLEPTMIVLQMPLAARSNLSRLTQLPVMTPTGSTVPLSELGDFHQSIQDKPIYMKDLRPVDYVTGETVGRLASPIYGMFEVEDMLKEYQTPDGVTMSGNYLGPPGDSHQSGFEWGGEWTVTYETFRDMGIAFAVAIILIYMLVVWEFGNFTLPAIVVAPIPLTLIGIIPGHWLLNAEFTATSMIGFIALAGIIVRNSILLVDFAKHEIDRGVHVVDAVINSCKTRTRPIIITAFALVAGSSVILFDPIFQGMAVSLLFGVLVSTALTLLIIPLGCISARKAFGVEDDEGPLGAGGAGGAAVAVPGGLSPEHGSTASGKTPSSRSRSSLLYYAGLYVFVLAKDIVFGVIDLTASIIKIFKRKSGSRTDASAVSNKSASSEVKTEASRKPKETQEQRAQEVEERKASVAVEPHVSEESSNSSKGTESTASQRKPLSKRRSRSKKKIGIQDPAPQKTTTPTTKKSTINNELVSGIDAEPLEQQAAGFEGLETSKTAGSAAVKKRGKTVKRQPRKARRGIQLKKDMLEE